MADKRSLEEQVNDMRQEINKLTREKDIARLTAEYTKLGYGELAEATATAYLDGDSETMFKNQQTIMDAKVKDAVADMDKAETKTRNESRSRKQPGSFQNIFTDDPFTAGFMRS